MLRQSWSHCSFSSPGHYSMAVTSGCLPVSMFYFAESPSFFFRLVLFLCSDMVWYFCICVHSNMHYNESKTYMYFLQQHGHWNRDQGPWSPRSSFHLSRTAAGGDTWRNSKQFRQWVHVDEASLGEKLKPLSKRGQNCRHFFPFHMTLHCIICFHRIFFMKS